MSVCMCPQRAKPLDKRQWFVVARNCNHSAFGGGHWQSSDYSAIQCHQCHDFWRTKSAYVDDLKDGRIV